MEIRKEFHAAIELLDVTPLVFDSSDKVGEHKQFFFCAGSARANPLISNVLRSHSLEFFH